MYSGHIIIQGCQLWPFEGNKYLQLHTFHGLNFVWTHSCNECHSPSFIHLPSLRSRHFIQIKTTEREREKSCCHWCGPNPGLFGGSCTHYREGWKLYRSARMMDDKLNLCPGTEGEWWQRYLSWEWRLGSGEAGCLKAQDVDKFIHWTPPPGPFLCFESSPLAKWPALLMLPMCKEKHAAPGIPPPLPRVLHSSLTHFWPCLFGLLQQLLDFGSVG